ncbi:GA45A-like protein [Mya arenaria]|uniref:GA45A-like protein n=1 Tax=Mya arenaria TaxID=6604 RepID=A0ABY7FV54_MYAAR|nr:growth arrest and DNA damage-inducible protein GADD45 alpha-like [Mya arenaria]XP_052774734.1 growth arrest and DNA damage-inducible protein GADD45 alpha-like [Mya arenaria]WAR24728.1 GA45A-like protein [Mya arenaria]
MTLPDHEEISMPEKKIEKSSGQCLCKVLVRARDDGRLVCGVFDSASRLTTRPEEVMVCVLPETAPADITTSMQHKLIEAYCLENDIQVIKIKNSEKMGILLNKDAQLKSEMDNPVTTPTLDTSCVLVEWPPKPHINKHEHRLLDFIWSKQVTQLDLPI